MTQTEEAEIANALASRLEFKLAAAERAQLVKIAIRSGILWGAVAAICWYAIWLSIENDEPAWAGLLFFIIVFAVRFGIKRKAMMRRVELIWEETLRRNGLLEQRAKLQNQANSNS